MIGMILLQRSRSLRRRKRLKFKMMLLEDSASLNHRIKGKMSKEQMLSRISVQIRIMVVFRILVTFQEDLMISASKAKEARIKRRRKRRGDK